MIDSSDCSNRLCKDELQILGSARQWLSDKNHPCRIIYIIFNNSKNNHNNGTKDTKGRLQAKKNNCDINRYMNSQTSECLPMKQGDFQGLVHEEQPWFAIGQWEIYQGYRQIPKRLNRTMLRAARYGSIAQLHLLVKTIFWYQRMRNESMQFLMHYDYNDFVARLPITPCGCSWIRFELKCCNSHKIAILPQYTDGRRTAQRIHVLFLTRGR